MNARNRTSKQPGYRAQAITEFAIVLPILLVLLFGILEVGRLMYLYAVISNASRDGARYASAVGLDDDGLHQKYNYCEGIRTAARHFAYFIDLPDDAIEIVYDTGPSGTLLGECPSGAETTSIDIPPGSRVVVTITGTYNPLVNLVPIRAKTFTSTSARTILGEINLTTGSASIPGPGVPGPGPAATDTPTPTSPSGGPIATDTPTPTPTSTQGKDTWITFTPTATPTDTPTLDPNAPTPTDTPTPDPSLPTATPTFIPTSTPMDTPTPTYTPTATPTAVPGCDSITRGLIETPGDTNTMKMTITNPHGPLTVSSVEVHWNYLTGAPGGRGGTGAPLNLLYASLAGTQFFSGTNSSGNFIITPSTTVIIPGNNVTSTIEFTFAKVYRFPDVTVDFIRISLATLGCENYSIQRP